VLSHPTWSSFELNTHFSGSASGLGKLFTISAFNRAGGSEFEATISISDPTNPRVVRVSHDTNAGMRKFILEPAPAAPPSAG
jgi:hypothetical protein